MNTEKPTRHKADPAAAIRSVILAILFVCLTALLFLGFRQDEVLQSEAQAVLYPLGMALVLASLAVTWLWMQTADPRQRLNLSPRARRWMYPVISGVLALACMSLAYMYLGIWPIGERSAMIVDMHHQYAPLLAQLREMLLHGGNPLYSFNIGLGTSFIPLFGYYLASPFNLLLTLFPENLLTEGIVVITLLKNALSAAFFAACLQYVYKKRSPVIPAMAIMYSLMMYLLAYSWNIMWLDVIMVLPLAVLFLERLLRTGKYLGYILTLAYALFANYYIAFMMCLFLVLYFIVYAVREKRSGKVLRQSAGRFVLGSVLGGGLVMFLLIPVYLGLRLTSAAGAELPELSTNFSFFDLFGQQLFRTVPTIRSGNLPNIYCGLLPVLLAPIFATTKAIPLRRRISYLGLLGIMAFSFVINQMDLVWHGLHSPNDLPYRFSFLYSFVLLLIAYEVLLHLKDIAFKQIGGTLAVLAVYLILLERLGKGEGETYSFDNIYVSMLLLAVYAVIVALAACRKWSLRPAYMFLTLIVTAEMLMNAGATMRTLHANEYFTAHDDYVDNEITESWRDAVDETKRIGDLATDNGFYRMEFLPRRTTVDPALYDYRGLTVFASSNPYNTVKFMGSMGYAINGVNSYLYHSFVAPIDSLLGLKYVILETPLASHQQLQQIGSTTTGNTTRYIYENPYALPLGYMVKPTVRQWIPTEYDPITSQNTLFKRMTGNNVDTYTVHPVTVAADSTGIATISENTSNGVDTAFSLSGIDGESTSAHFNVTIPQDGQAFIFLDCRAAESLSASQGGNSWDVTPHEPYLIDAGNLKAGDTVEVTVTATQSCIGTIHVATLNKDVFEQNMRQLAQGGLDVTSFSDTHIEGTVDAAEAGIMMTSITYDEGWTVKIDGKEVKTISSEMREAADTGTVGMAEALLAFEVPEGTHTITLTFFPKGLALGLVLSVISLAGLILLLIYQRHRKKVRLAHSIPAGAAGAADAPLSAGPVSDEPDTGAHPLTNSSWTETSPPGDGSAIPSGSGPVDDMDANLLFQAPPAPDSDSGQGPGNIDDERGDSL